MARSKDQEKAAHIIDAAFAVFGERGYESTRVSHIAQRAGVSSGTIYTYFKDKKDLFQATVKSGWENYVARIGKMIDAYAQPEERLRQLVDIGFRSLKASLPLLRGMLFESSQMDLLEKNIQSLCALVEELLEARREAPLRELDPAQRRAAIRITLVGVLFSAALAKPQRIDAEIGALKKAVERIVFPRGLAPQGRKAAVSRGLAPQERKAEIGRRPGGRKTETRRGPAPRRRANAGTGDDA